MADYLPTRTRVDAKLDGATWTDVTASTLRVRGLSLTYGIYGAGPLDNLAGTGTCRFALSNIPIGTWSPSHGSVTSGWGLGTPVRVVFEPSVAADVVKFLGTVQYIKPSAGQYRAKTVDVVCHDIMGKLAGAVLRTLTVQSSVTERALIDAIIAALPASATPAATDLDAALDTYPWAFDDVGREAVASSLLKDVLDSAFGAMACEGNGTLIYRNRESRTFTASVDTFVDDDLLELDVPSDVNDCTNRVIVNVPQIEKGGSDEVLAAAEGTDSAGIGVGETAELWLTYRDPDLAASAASLVGGTSMIAPAATTDYTFFSAPAGAGTNITGSMTVTGTYYANQVKLEITNGHASLTAYRNLLQVRGRAVRRYPPIMVESSASQDYGERPVRIDLRYQDSTSVAQFIADYIRGQYEVWTDRPRMAQIACGKSHRLMEHAMLREPLDRITIQETLTGMDGDAIIQSVQIDVSSMDWISCRWGLSPQSSFMFVTPWLLGTAGRGELGETTVLG